VSALVDHRSGLGDDVPPPNDAEGSTSYIGNTPADDATALSPTQGSVDYGLGQDGFSQDNFTHIEQDAPRSAPIQLRIDFGAHLEANYQRLVAQLYAITLDPGEAHDVVQDAYSRAWRDWERISREADPTGWVRSVAVRSSARSWRRIFGGRSHADGEADPRTAAMLAALKRLRMAERRCVVLHHMAGLTVAEIAIVERSTSEKVRSRLSKAQGVITEGMADVLPAVLGLEGGTLGQDSQFDGGDYR
jgi:DNA-directed RNA polymerase specialized sigma24 family protein